MAMLMTAAVSNLAASLTLRPTDATSSVATEIDVPKSTPVKARSESLPPKDTPLKTESTSPPASISSSPAQPLMPAPGTSIESGPQPSTPSCLAQAAAYFPPAQNPNRQSSVFQVPSSILQLLAALPHLQCLSGLCPLTVPSQTRLGKSLTRPGFPQPRSRRSSLELPTFVLVPFLIRSEREYDKIPSSIPSIHPSSTNPSLILKDEFSAGTNLSATGFEVAVWGRQTSGRRQLPSIKRTFWDPLTTWRVDLQRLKPFAPDSTTVYLLPNSLVFSLGATGKPYLGSSIDITPECSPSLEHQKVSDSGIDALATVINRRVHHRSRHSDAEPNAGGVKHGERLRRSMTHCRKLLVDVELRSLCNVMDIVNFMFVGDSSITKVVIDLPGSVGNPFNHPGPPDLLAELDFLARGALFIPGGNASGQTGNCRAVAGVPADIVPPFHVLKCPDVNEDTMAIALGYAAQVAVFLLNKDIEKVSWQAHDRAQLASPGHATHAAKSQKPSFGPHHYHQRWGRQLHSADSKAANGPSRNLRLIQTTAGSIDVSNPAPASTSYGAESPTPRRTFFPPITLPGFWQTRNAQPVSMFVKSTLPAMSEDVDIPADAGSDSATVRSLHLSKVQTRNGVNHGQSSSGELDHVDRHPPEPSGVQSTDTGPDASEGATVETEGLPESMPAPPDGLADVVIASASTHEQESTLESLKEQSSNWLTTGLSASVGGFGKHLRSGGTRGLFGGGSPAKSNRRGPGRPPTVPKSGPNSNGHGNSQAKETTIRTDLPLMDANLQSIPTSQ
ncbi:uncharacterized protein EI90DRAFT_3286909 [Cantharellus anzutake]|uniref:uncharacterized protein n=1 Tax=Cantharellus anzutake TaxID=1750568 RepID=UPI001906E3FF|nr:uncharacterized protein EI90DRAFT_3286909 [Cantharellus anzutake]KAF8338217.1 hypothetical protein EI90DRAFT_3286909 [Cantharellus anzutake]